jgi:hypothetical protein
MSILDVSRDMFVMVELDNKNRLLGREFEEKESLLHLHEVLALLDSLC